jgi:small-conductance mechanosensitive channel
MQQWLREVAGISAPLQLRLLETLIVILVLWIGRRLFLAGLYARVQDPRIRYKWRKTATYIAFLVGLLALGSIWIARAGSLATFVGLLTAGLAIALKDLVANLAGWAFIVWRRPFDVGDRVQVGDHAGDVIDLQLFQFTLNEIGNWVAADQSTGRIIHIPNGKVFSEPLANYDKGFRYIWNEVPVTITFESNWKKAKDLLTEIGNRHAEQLSDTIERELVEASRQFMIAYNKLTPIVYVSVADSGVTLTVRYLIRPRFRRGSEQAIWQDVLDAFAAAPDIDFAYPTVRQFRNYLEGKPGARATVAGAPGLE